MQEFLVILPQVLDIFLQIIRNWWWIVVPLLLFFPLKKLYLWRRGELFFGGVKIIMLEIRSPKEVLKPLKAMEQVFSSLWGNVYDSPNWKETWFEGKGLMSFSLEIVSIGGQIHFFIRIPEILRNAIESSIYSQYPEAEITLVDDYTKYVPQDIPNKEWDIWGCDYELIKENCYPIKTFKFFEEKPDSPIEEKRLDPLAPLLEGLAKLVPGEQLWLQIVACPITDKETKHVTEAKKMIDKLAKRPGKKKLKPIILEAAEILITGKPSDSKEEKRDIVISEELMFTPGERGVVEKIENKASNQSFLTNIRFVYLAKRDIFFKPQIKTVIGFFTQFSATNMNSLKPWSKTGTKIQKPNYLVDRRLFLRKRKMFRNYINRLPPLFPKQGGTFILDTEELATIYHLTGKTVASAPFMSRVEAKKGEAPLNLPVE